MLPSSLFILASSVCKSLQYLTSALIHWVKVVIYLGSLVQLCCGDGGTLQTNITGICGKCSQCLDHTGFSPAYGMCAFPVYISQTLGCSAGNCLMWALVCLHFPGLSRSDSGSLILHKGADFVGPAFCTVPGPSTVQVTRCLAHVVTPS